MPKVGRPKGSYGPKRKYKAKVTAVAADANDAWRSRTIAAIENLMDAASAQGFAVADIILPGGSVMRFEVGATKPKEDIEDILEEEAGDRGIVSRYNDSDPIEVARKAESQIKRSYQSGRRVREPMKCCGSVGTRHKVGCHGGITAPAPRAEGDRPAKELHKCDDCAHEFKPDPDDYGTVQCPECKSYNSTPTDEIPKV